MPPDGDRDNETLRDILAAVDLIQRRMQGRTSADLESDIDLQDIVLYRLLVIGEAAKRLSDEVRSAIPSIPWVQVEGLRNRVIHGYDSVDFHIIWDTVRVDLPPLKLAVSEYLNRIG